MNRQLATLLGGVGVACGAIGYFTGVLVTDGRLRKEYEESARAYRRAMDMTQDITGDVPEMHEEALVIADGASVSIKSPVDGNALIDVTVYDADKTTHTPEAVNPYHVALNAIETPVHDFVDGTPNVYGISYIEEEEYFEDDGRAKYSVVIVMDAHNPTFFMDGELIDDWNERLGASIVKDFLDRVPPGINPVLYVRNHRTEEDYELTPERP